MYGHSSFSNCAVWEERGNPWLEIKPCQCQSVLFSARDFLEKRKSEQWKQKEVQKECFDQMQESRVLREEHEPQQLAQVPTTFYMHNLLKKIYFFIIFNWVWGEGRWTWMQMLTEFRRGLWILWNWSDRQLWTALDEWLELNLGLCRSKNYS